MNLRNKITFGVITTAAIPLLLLVAFCVVQFSQIKLQDTIDNMALVLDNEAIQLSSYFANRKAEIETLSDSEELESMDFIQMRPYLMAQLARLGPDYEKFIVGHPSGHFQNTSGGNSLQQLFRTFDDKNANAKRKSISKRDYWQNTVGNNKTGERVITVSEPMISYTTEVKQIVVASSVIRNNQVVGMLGGALPWKNIEARIAETRKRFESKIGEGAKFFLLSPSGHYWYHWDDSKVVHYKKDNKGRVFLNEIGEKVAVKTSILDDDNFYVKRNSKRILAEHKGYVDIPAEGGIPAQYLLYSKVESNDYILGLFVPKTIVADQVNQVRVFLVGLSVAVILLLILTSYWLAHRISKPITKLSSMTRAIRQGHRVEHFDPVGQDEIAQLTKDVFSMLDVLKSKEMELHKSDERFGLAMAGANDGLWDWDVVTDHVYYSPRWKSMLGYQVHELKDDFSPFKRLMHPDDVDMVEEAISSLFESQKNNFEYEFRLQHKDGHYVNILSRAQLLRGADGDPVRMVGTHVDITERKKQEEKIRQLNEDLEARVIQRTQELDERNVQLESAKEEAEMANEAKSQFLANMSHELRTPLNAIVGFTTRMKRYLEQNRSDRLMEAVDLVNRNGHHLLGLINQILDFSKIEEGKLEMSQDVFALSDLVSECMDSLTPLAEQKGVVLKARLDWRGDVVADRLRMNQVIMNLLSNGIKFSPKGEVLCIVTQAECDGKPCVELSVKDTGIGIAEDQQQFLFNKFTQLNRATITDGSAGTGLGLSITKEIVTLHGGEVSVESALGKGSCFTVTLPLVTPLAA